MIYVKIGVVALLSLSACIQLFQYETWWFIQNVNLMFHESGHIIFIFFGNFFSILGGSLLEILVPAIVVLHFVYKGKPFSAACICWWLATAFLSVSIYASDAQERVLPLITNDVSTHDWYNLLLALNILKYDDVVGAFFWGAGCLSIVLMWYLLYQDRSVRSLLQSFVQ